MTIEREMFWIEGIKFEILNKVGLFHELLKEIYNLDKAGRS